MREGTIGSAPMKREAKGRKTPKADIHFLCNADFQFMGVARAQLIRYLYRSGFSVHLWKQANNRLNPVLNECVKVVHNSPATSLSGAIGKIANKLGFALTALTSFLLRFGRKRPVLISSPNDPSLLACVIKLIFPNVFWMAYLWDPPGVHPEMRGLRSKVRGVLVRIYRRALLHADLVIVGIHPLGIKGYRLSLDRTVYVTNGVDPNLFDPKGVRSTESFASKRFSVLMVEKSRSSSGLRELMEAMGKSLSSIPNIHLDLVGFMERDSGFLIEKWASEFGIEGHVTYHGLQPHERLPHFISRADVCVNFLPSGPHRDECYALKVYSYLAMGKAVICSDLPAMKSIIRHKENGYFVHAGDPDELCSALVLIEKDDRLRRKLEENARESVLKFCWDNIMGTVVTNLTAKLETGNFLRGHG